MVVVRGSVTCLRLSKVTLLMDCGTKVPLDLGACPSVQAGSRVDRLWLCTTFLSVRTRLLKD